MNTHAHAHTHINNLEGISNYRQMYSLILLQHFCHWRMWFAMIFFFFFAVVLIVYCRLIKARLSLMMITALSRWRQGWQTLTEGGTKATDRQRERVGGGGCTLCKDPREFLGCLTDSPLLQQLMDGLTWILVVLVSRGQVLLTSVGLSEMTEQLENELPSIWLHTFVSPSGWAVWWPLNFSSNTS